MNQERNVETKPGTNIEPEDKILNQIEELTKKLARLETKGTGDLPDASMAGIADTFQDGDEELQDNFDDDADEDDEDDDETPLRSGGTSGFSGVVLFHDQIIYWLTLQVPVKKMLELAKTDKEHPYTGKRSAFYSYVRRVRLSRSPLAISLADNNAPGLDWRTLKDKDLRNPSILIDQTESNNLRRGVTGSLFDRSKTEIQSEVKLYQAGTVEEQVQAAPEVYEEIKEVTSQPEEVAPVFEQAEESLAQPVSQEYQTEQAQVVEPEEIEEPTIPTPERKVKTITTQVGVPRRTYDQQKVQPVQPVKPLPRRIIGAQNSTARETSLPTGETLPGKQTARSRYAEDLAFQVPPLKKKNAFGERTLDNHKSAKINQNGNSNADSSVQADEATALVPNEPGRSSEKTALKPTKENKSGGEFDYIKPGLENNFYRIFQQLGSKPTLSEPLIIGVASALRGEGRSTIALGLASSLSRQTPLPVVLVEADLASPTYAQDFDLPNKGLSEYLNGEIEMDDLLWSIGQDGLSVILAGDCQGQPLQTLRSARLTTLLNVLSRQFAAVVVDLPPLSSTGESTRVIDHLDQVLMIVEAGSTPQKVVKTALNLIPAEKVAGVLLNRTNPTFGVFNWFKRFFR